MTNTITSIEDLQKLAQEWERLLFSTGGALNLQKCFWFLLTWRWNNGHAQYASENEVPGDLSMTSGNTLNSPTVINRISPTESYRTLGVHISPSGSNLGALQTLITIVTEYSANIRSSHLNRSEAIASYIQHLLPKLRYQLPVLSVSQKDCDHITSIALLAFLP